jgi:hypothetical protein
MLPRHSGRRTAVIGLAVLALALTLSASAQAATFPVINTDDAGPGSLRQAITDANAAMGPDVVDATGVSGAIDLESTLPSLSEDTESLEIRGPGAAELTVRRGVATDLRIFATFPGGIAEISGLRIANGRTTDSAFGGAAILNDQATLTLRDSVVTRNVNAGVSSGENGGGIYNFSASDTNDATTTIIDSTVRDNTAAGYGAAIFNNGFGTVTLLRSTVSGNVAQGGAGCVGGGGIHTMGTLSVINSTVTGNTAPPNGPVGGIYSCTTTGGSNTIRNSTIAANRASPGQPANVGIALQGAVSNAMTLKSTILARPLSGGPNCLVGAPATLTSQGYNLASDASCNLTRSTDQPSTNPDLGALQNNGGPTRTMALPSGSPAIDKGIGGGLTTDQRGLDRTVDFPGVPSAAGGDAADVGAFEFQPPFPPTAEPPNEPSNEFSFGKVKKLKRKGKARILVNLPGPGIVELDSVGRSNEAVAAAQTKHRRKRAAGAGKVRLNVTAIGKKKRKLRKKGKAKVRVDATFRPDGGNPNTKSKKLKLVKRR